MASHVDRAFDASVEDGLGFGLHPGALGWVRGGDVVNRSHGLWGADDFESVPRGVGGGSGGGNGGPSLAGRIWGALGIDGSEKLQSKAAAGVAESALPPALQHPWAAERDKAGAFQLTAEQVSSGACSVFF